MRLLFAISVFCFCTVLWIALSLARRLRIAQSKEARRIEQGTSTEFFEAGEFRTPRPLPMKQEIRPKVRQTWEQPANEIRAAKDGSDKHVRPGLDVVAPRHNSGLQLITAAKPPAPTNTDEPSLSKPVTPEENAARRKSPQPVRASGFRRVDLSHYTEDMGDLTDPYTHPLRNSGTQGPRSKSS